MQFEYGSFLNLNVFLIPVSANFRLIRDEDDQFI